MKRYKVKPCGDEMVKRFSAMFQRTSTATPQPEYKSAFEIHGAGHVDAIEAVVLAIKVPFRAFAAVA